MVTSTRNQFLNERVDASAKAKTLKRASIPPAHGSPPSADALADG